MVNISQVRPMSTYVPLLAALLALGACGADPIPAPPRPVLVAHPGPVAGTRVAAFAGEVRARQESALAFQVGGKLVRRDVDVGDAVSRGDLLAELDPGDLRAQAQAAQAQLAAAEGELSRARADRARYAQLAGQQLVSRSALDAQDAAYAAAAGQAKAARADLQVARNQAAYTRLLAPSDGRIASRQAEAGQVVAAGQTVFTLAGDQGREVAIALPESDVDDFSIGQPALIALWNTPGARLPGKIREIAPAADPQTRTYAARVALTAEAASKVSLGQSARVFLQPAGSDAASRATLQVPLAAIQRGDKGGTSVWVVDPGTRKLHAAPVRLGTYGEDSVPVLSGLSAGDWVVVAGGHLLREGEQVAPVDRDNRPVALSSTPAQGK